MDDYKIIGGKKLRCGYTTGTCAAAAAKGAVTLLFGEDCKEVVILTPIGKTLRLPLEDIRRNTDTASCAVRKDAGDDPDSTNGILVYATAGFHESGILIEGGEGIGRVTKPGLCVPVGEAAINPVPRRMITEQVQQVCAQYGRKGIRIRLSIPGGETLAEHTFNPRLGIIGGLSILGTTGIVEPMSDAAVIETVRAELSVRRAAGETLALITPGNYGKMFLAGFETAALGEKLFLRKKLPLPIKCGNFIGDAIDSAFDFGFKDILVAGHIGKLIKLATGNFNTHSKYGDPRIMIFAAFAGLSGMNQTGISRLFDCPTSERAIEVLQEQHCWDAALNRILAEIQTQLNRRRIAQSENSRIGGILFSSRGGFLGCTDSATVILSDRGTP